MTVQATNATTASTASSASPGVASAAAGSSEIENRFLTLLVTQLRNQDPLNPLDNAQLTTQLAQISTVSGVDRLNATMASLAASLGAGQSMQAANLMGHSVLVPGSRLALEQGKAQGGFNLAAAADLVTVTVKNASGAVVRTLNLGARPMGTGDFAWDGVNDANGAAPDGGYTFEVNASGAAGKVAGTALMSGVVLGVVPGASGGATQLQVGSLGRFDLTQILEIH
jgi:flagellar basal-body rod modification protein FlgD